MVCVHKITTQSNCNFKGDIKKTNKGNDYYHTNSAIKIGAPLAGIAALAAGFDYYCNSTAKNLIEKTKTDLPTEALNNIKTLLKENKKICLISGLVGVAGHLGISSYIDYKRNQRAKEIANLTQNNNDALSLMNDVTMSKKGNVCLDSNIGSKLGGWLGAGFGLVSGGIGVIIANKRLNSAIKNSAEKLPKEIESALSKGGKVGGLLGLSIGVALSSLGGWLLGKWSDHIANKDTYKNA